jgi:hypothetical protein
MMSLNGCSQHCTISVLVNKEKKHALLVGEEKHIICATIRTACFRSQLIPSYIAQLLCGGHKQSVRLKQAHGLV